jgi:hypothetical protein
VDTYNVPPLLRRWLKSLTPAEREEFATWMCWPKELRFDTFKLINHLNQEAACPGKQQ